MAIEKDNLKGDVPAAGKGSGKSPAASGGRDLSGRMVSGEVSGSDDESLDRALRPQFFKDYIGQESLKSNLDIAIRAALKRKEPLDHVLVYGPPGLGKTTIASIIANEMKSSLITTSGPVLEKKGDLAALLLRLKKDDVLFIDEIHRLNPVIEEFLYPAMEDFNVDIMMGEGPAARSMRVPVAPFTLIGATTKAGSLTSPLRARFGIVERLNYYSHEELRTIVDNSSRRLKLKIDAEGALEIARRSRGTPRIANKLLRRVRDYADVNNSGMITGPVAKKALELLNIDELGFDYFDRQYLLTIIQDFQGKPVGLNTLAATLGEDRDTIEDVLEPYLLQEGFIQRTPRGRVVTSKAYAHFGIEEEKQ